MVVIRLSRTGANKRPFYRLVVADRRFARDGRYIERLGYFNPIASGSENRLHIEKERVAYWLSKGAQPSERVNKLLKDYEKIESMPKESPSKAKASSTPAKSKPKATKGKSKVTEVSKKGATASKAKDQPE